MGRTALVVGIIIGVVVLLALGVIFLLPIPYTAIEVHDEVVPYVATETYTDQVPITVQQCQIALTTDPLEWASRGLQALQTGNPQDLIRKCQAVLQYQQQTKTRDVVKYQVVQKEVPVTKSATPFMMWTGQVKYYYHV